MIKLILKRILFVIGLILTLPLIAVTLLEGVLSGNRKEVVFGSCKELLSLVPTTFGQFIRGAYYWAVCRQVSPDACFLFGSMLAHRNVIVRRGVVLGVYTIIGYADIGENVLFGARVSLLSGKYQHGRPGERAENGETSDEYQMIRIGRNSWIGQEAVIMADVGENCTIGAGSVVYKEVPDNTTVMGNPARKVSF